MKQPYATLWFDGGSRGNPGLSAGGYRLLTDDAEIIGSQVLDHATNNEAEYTGLIIGLEAAIAHSIPRLLIKGDSQLVINQVDRLWNVNKPHLRPYCDRARDLLRSFEKRQLVWIRRNENGIADWACNCAMDEAEGKPSPKRPGEGSVAKKLPTIAQMVFSPEQFKFKQWAALKVPGSRDEFSSKRLPKLKELAPDFATQVLVDCWPDASPADIARCYRWHLRAKAIAPDSSAEQLSEFAVHKCRVDMEINQNAQKRYAGGMR